jgi:hypothetical protein
MRAGESMPLVRAVRAVRPMAGRSGSTLFECDDGAWYVVKPWNNPQGSRTLINEAISTLLLSAMGIATPRPALVRLPGDNLAIHFGSRYPGPPGTVNVYDYLPDSTLGRVVNLDDFLGILVFDKWVSNGDGRQAVFYRARVKSREEESVEWVAEMIDNGATFQGQDWTFRDSPAQGAYRQRLIYRGRKLADLEYWFDVLADAHRDLSDRVFSALPELWIAGQEDRLNVLLSGLRLRRGRIRELVSGTLGYLAR